MTTTMRQSFLDWIYSTLIILAAVAVIAVAAPKVAAAESAPISYAQVQLKQQGPGGGPGAGAPGSLKGETRGVKVICAGKTTAECCKGIDFCGCLANPMPKKGDEDKPLSCSSSPPKEPAPKG